MARGGGGGGSIAVSLHDVEPATFERCALIRDWLDDLGIDRVTLLVIPAPDLHPFHDRRPDLAEWLDDRGRAGDAIAQHGFQHLRLQSGRGAVLAGRRVLKLAGIEPRGFVAPALTLGTSTAFKRWISPGVVRLGARMSGDLLRLDLHPADLDHIRCVGAVENVLRGARRRSAVTYDELAAA